MAVRNYKTAQDFFFQDTFLSKFLYFLFLEKPLASLLVLISAHKTIEKDKTGMNPYKYCLKIRTTPQIHHHDEPPNKPPRKSST
jgi:hypothetical protein